MMGVADPLRAFEVDWTLEGVSAFENAIRHHDDIVVQFGFVVWMIEGFDKDVSARRI